MFYMAVKLKRTGYLLIIVLLLLTAGTVVFFSSYRPLLPGYHAFCYTPEKYLALKGALEKERKSLREKFRKAKGRNGRDARREANREVFRSVIMDKVFPFWYGTWWSFHGTTEIPGESSVACGYFVTTVLRDAGCRIERSRLAQVPSEEMIKTLVKEKYIRRFSNSPYEEFVKAMKKEGPGIFVIGLDNHTGFWVNHNEESFFIHSSGTLPFCVVSEPGDASGVLEKSKYRVAGLLTKDDGFIDRWVQ